MNAADEERLNSWICEIVDTIVDGVQWRQEGDERRALGQGGLTINTRTGAWYHHGAGRGGYSAVPLIMLLNGNSYTQASVWGDTWLKSHPGAGAGITNGDDTEIESAAIAQEILDKLVEPAGTPAIDYARSRGIEIESFSALPVKFLPFARAGESAIAGILTSHGRVVGVQLGYLDADGHKSLVSPVRRRFNLEKAPDAVFALPAPAGVTDMLADTVICEGLEDFLSVAGMNRPWNLIGLPGIGTMRHLSVKNGERVIVVRDGDALDSPADKALIAGIDHLILQGAVVRVTETPLGEDANSILQKEGLSGLVALIGTARNPAMLSRDGEIVRLSRLDPLDYEKERKVKAGELGIRVGALDDAVQRQRRAAGTAPVPVEGPPDGAGQGLDLEDLVRWPETVEGSALLAELEAALRRYIILGDHEVVVVVLWILGTHVFNEFAIFPRLFITAPQRGCGKTTLLDLLELLVPRPIKVENITTAALFRTIEAARPSVLLDEADTFVRKNEELRGVIDSGHKRNGSVIRLVEIDGKLEPRKFSTWAPMALAAIQDLPGTIEDRSIRVKMERRRADEPVQSLYRAKGIANLARKIARWSADNAVALSAADPEMPDGIVNRTANNWQPMLAIAEAAGGTWPSRVREAAIALSSEGNAEGTDINLLSDIRATFLEKPAVTALSSDQLVAGLILLEDRPWAEINHGRPLTKHSLARHLRPFRISPSTIQLASGRGAATAKGYRLQQFQDAFERYLPPLPPGPTDPTVKPSDIAETLEFSSDPKPSDGSDGVMSDGLENVEDSSVSAVSDGLTVENGEGRGDAEKGAHPDPDQAADGDAQANGQSETNPVPTPGYGRRLTQLDRAIIEYDQAYPDVSLDHLRQKFGGRTNAEIADLLGRMRP